VHKLSCNILLYYTNAVFCPVMEARHLTFDRCLPFSTAVQVYMDMVYVMKV